MPAESPIFLHTLAVILTLNMPPKGQKCKALSPHPDAPVSTKMPPNAGKEGHEMYMAICIRKITFGHRLSQG
jgi:hypothetical protein